MRFQIRSPLPKTVSPKSVRSYANEYCSKSQLRCPRLYAPKVQASMQVTTIPVPRSVASDCASPSCKYLCKQIRFQILNPLPEIARPRTVGLYAIKYNSKSQNRCTTLQAPKLLGPNASEHDPKHTIRCSRLQPASEYSVNSQILWPRM